MRALAYDRRVTPKDEALILELVRTLAAERARVFGAFTSGDRVAQWWGPDGFTIPGIEFDPEVGGSYRIHMQPPEGDSFALTGEFRAVEPPERLAFTFVWEQPDPDDAETLVELSFEDRGHSTRVALRQGSFRTEARRRLHREGWGQALDKLAAWL